MSINIKSWKSVALMVVALAVASGIVWSIFAQSDPLARRVPRDASFYLRWRKLPETESAPELHRWMEQQLMVAKDWTRLMTASRDIAYAAWTKDGQVVRVVLARGAKELRTFSHILSPDDVRLTWNDGVVGWVTQDRARAEIQDLEPEATLGAQISSDVSEWSLWTAVVSLDSARIPGTEIFFSSEPQQWNLDARDDRMIWTAMQKKSPSKLNGSAMARSMDEVLEMIPKNSKVIFHGWEPGAKVIVLNNPSPMVNTPPLLPDHISWSEQFRHTGTLALVPVDESLDEKISSEKLGMIWISSEVKPADQWKEVFESEWASVMATEMPRRESATLQDGSYRLDLYPSTQPIIGTPIPFEDQAFYKTERGPEPFVYGVMKSRLVVASDERLLSKISSEPESSAARLEIFKSCGRTHDRPFLWMDIQDSNRNQIFPLGLSSSQILWEASASGEVEKVCSWK